MSNLLSNLSAKVTHTVVLVWLALVDQSTALSYET